MNSEVNNNQNKASAGLIVSVVCLDGIFAYNVRNIIIIRYIPTCSDQLY